jgi:flagellar hook protein FlgE
MIGALYNGLSGLDSFQKALNTQSNNIANVNTVGYKQDQISFGDMMYQLGQGKGTSISTIEKNYSQGDLKVTDDPYDVGIEGDGFFLVSSLLGDSTQYTRSGNFRVGEDGSLETTDLRNVLGSAMIPLSDDNVIATDSNFTKFSPTFDRYIASQPIYTDTSITTVNAKSTDLKVTAKTDDISKSGQGYKTSGIKLSDVDKLSASYREVLNNVSENPTSASVASTQQVQQYTFDMNQLNDERDTLEIFIDNGYIRQQYEKDAQTTLNKFSDKISAIPGLTSSVDTNGKLTITNLIPGDNVNINSASLNDIAINDEIAQIGVMGQGQGAIDSARDAVKLAVENAGGKYLEISNSVERYNTDPVSNPEPTEIQLKLDNLGLAISPDAQFKIDRDGIIMMRQDDSKFVVGQLAIVNFTDKLSLNPAGANVFDKTELSGEPHMATGSVVLHQNTLELSNADLATGLTELMIYQRAYEANAKSITTSDEFLNIAIQLKK